MPFLDLTFALCLEAAIYIFGFFTEPKKVRLTWLNLNYTSEKAHFLSAYNQSVMIVSELKPPYSFFPKALIVAETSSIFWLLPSF